MKLSRSERLELTEAIIDAFTPDELKLLLRTGLGGNVLLYVNFYGAPFRSIVFDVVDYFDARGDAEQLIQAVGRRNPKNQRIHALLERLGAAIDTGQFEQVIRQVLPSMDIQLWRERLAELERCVCQVQVGSADSPVYYGTGFLVGTDLVLTCDHNVARLAEQSAPPGVTFLFDYKTGRSESAREEKGKTTTLTITVSGPRSKLVNSQSKLIEDQVMDYAIFRLESPVERERGYIRFPAVWPPITPGMPLFMIQHPEAAPLKLGFETNGVIGLSPDRRFIRHRVQAEPASSGSPVFNADWDLIGMHHAQVNDEGQAIGMAAIAEDLRRKGFDVTAGRSVQPIQPSSKLASAVEAAQRLRDYRPLSQVPAEPEEPPALDAYRKAAAVLDSFDIGKLKPLPPSEADELALVRFVTECTLRTDPERGPRYALNPDVRRATLAKMPSDDIKAALGHLKGKTHSV